MKKGEVIAHSQFQVTPYTYPTAEDITAQPASDSNPAAVTLDDRAVYAVLSAGSMKVTFDKNTGYVAYIDVDGTPMITDEAQLKPDFWRAATDNDFGADFQNRFAAWQHPQINKKNFTIQQEGANYVVTTEYDIKAVEATLKLSLDRKSVV